MAREHCGRQFVESKADRFSIGHGSGFAVHFTDETLFGVGVDLARFKAAVFGIDLNVSALVTVDGVLLSSGGRIGVAFD